MMVLSGSSRERTADEWYALLGGAGWELVSVERGMLTAEFLCIPRTTEGFPRLE
jgi:hypothetical protein